ncbi:hypothetical protein BJ546DRAFT_959631 [Cryomyces antarcticus]
MVEWLHGPGPGPGPGAGLTATHRDRDALPGPFGAEAFVSLAWTQCEGGHWWCATSSRSRQGTSTRLTSPYLTLGCPFKRAPSKQIGQRPAPRCACTQGDWVAERQPGQHECHTAQTRMRQVEGPGHAAQQRQGKDLLVSRRPSAGAAQFSAAHESSAAHNCNETGSSCLRLIAE